MATEAAWLNGNRLTERRKRKCALTSTGLLMEGLEAVGCASEDNGVTEMQDSLLYEASTAHFG
jgi:hypothetical protein